MVVHEKVDICQFEWYRDNKNLLPSQAISLGRFFLIESRMSLSDKNAVFLLRLEHF